MAVQYVEYRTLERRGAVDPAPDEAVEGILLVGTRLALSFFDNHSQYGEDDVSIFPAVHNGERCWLRRDHWCPAYGYSASGTQEFIISFEDGVKLFLERGVFKFPIPNQGYEGPIQTIVHTLEALKKSLALLPEGATCDVLSGDLEAGNFETANFQLPDGEEYQIIYDLW